MKKKAIAAVLSGFLLVIGIIALHQSTFAAKTQVATLSSVKGKVAVKAKGTTTWKTAKNNMSINQGDVIKTSSGSSTIIKFTDGTMVKVGPLSSMTLSKLGQTGSGSDTSLNVASGKTWSRVRRRTDDSKFKIKTPTAVAGVRGTFFSSEAADDSSTFDVFDGEVEVSSLSDPGQSVSVKAHQRTSVAANKAPAAPSAIPEDEEDAGRGGFSETEYTSATFEIQISISPQVVQPGQKATVSVQVLKNGEPYQKEVNLKLALNGSAQFESSGANTVDVATDGKGAVSLSITDSVEESITVDASMSIKVAK